MQKYIIYVNTKLSTHKFPLLSSPSTLARLQRPRKVLFRSEEGYGERLASRVRLLGLLRVLLQALLHDCIRTVSVARKHTRMEGTHKYHACE
jgi:hypothetical protein